MLVVSGQSALAFDRVAEESTDRISVEFDFFVFDDCFDVFQYCESWKDKSVIFSDV